MSVRIFHTADLHLGMKFAYGYSPSTQEKLRSARYETLAREVALANEQKCHVFLIAGDLFDQHQLGAKDIQIAAEKLNQFEGSLVVIMPGNHDYFHSSSELWERFRSKAGSSILIMDKPDIYDLTKYKLDVLLYAAPCTSRISPSNAIGWIKKARLKLSASNFHIGVAHGSVKGISPDFNNEYYPMTQEELGSAGLDVWLMGHTHIRYPEIAEGTDKKILFPSTPEPDGFDRVHPGYAWIVDLGTDHSIRYRSIQTGKYRFFDWQVSLSNEGDLKKLQHEFKKMEPQVSLVRLKFTGCVPGDLLGKIIEFKEVLSKSFLHVEIDDSGICQAMNARDIDREFTKSSFPHRLLKALIEEGAEPLTVQTAYNLIREAKK